VNSVAQGNRRYNELNALGTNMILHDYLQSRSYKDEFLYYRIISQSLEDKKNNGRVCH